MKHQIYMTKKKLTVIDKIPFDCPAYAICINSYLCSHFYSEYKLFQCSLKRYCFAISAYKSKIPVGNTKQNRKQYFKASSQKVEKLQSINIKFLDIRLTCSVTEATGSIKIKHQTNESKFSWIMKCPADSVKDFP